VSERGVLTLKSGGDVKIPGVMNYAESGTISFTADGTTLATFFVEREWDFTPTEPTLPHGIYVSKIYAARPESGVKWSHSGSRGWRALHSTAYDGDVSTHADHPRDFYAANGGHADWWDRIVRLVAETPATR
jgi:hypothetical protein